MQRENSRTFIFQFSLHINNNRRKRLEIKPTVLEKGRRMNMPKDIVNGKNLDKTRKNEFVLTINSTGKMLW